MKIRLASATLQTDSIVDGDGIRTVLWTQGCFHDCPGCHNPETHDFNGGVEVDVDVVLRNLDDLHLQDGLTLSGGDPFFQAQACAMIAKHAKELGLNVWAYTGFLFEDIIGTPMQELLNYVDVLVDGKFVLALRSFDVAYRGSSNQRIIDVPKSLKTHKIHCITKYDVKPTKRPKAHKEHLYI